MIEKSTKRITKNPATDYCFYTDKLNFLSKFHPRTISQSIIDTQKTKRYIPNLNVAPKNNFHFCMIPILKQSRQQQ